MKKFLNKSRVIALLTGLSATSMLIAGAAETVSSGSRNPQVQEGIYLGDLDPRVREVPLAKNLNPSQVMLNLVKQPGNQLRLHNAISGPVVFSCSPSMRTCRYETEDMETTWTLTAIDERTIRQQVWTVNGDSYTVTLNLIPVGPSTSNTPAVSCPPPAPVPACPVCQDPEAIARRVREQTIREVGQEMQMEIPVSATGFGANPDQCVENAKRRAVELSADAIARCRSNLRILAGHDCALSQISVVRTPAKVLPVGGSSRVKVYKERDSQCRPEAIAQANQNALANCQQSTGVTCELSSPATEASYKQDMEGLFSRKEIRICEARAEAVPTGASAFSCQVEGRARPKF